jgi:hypothetical protein
VQLALKRVFCRRVAACGISLPALGQHWASAGRSFGSNRSGQNIQIQNVQIMAGATGRMAGARLSISV